MSSFDEDYYKNMLINFRTSDLQALLTMFGRNRAGRKSDLKDRAISLLINKPPGLNHQLFLSKIVEIYQSMQNRSDVSNNEGMMHNNLLNQRQVMSMGMQAQPQPQRMFTPPPPQYSQQPSQHTMRAGLPQVMPQMQRGIYGGNIQNNNFQYSYQVASRNILPQVSQPSMNQQPNLMAPGPVYNTDSTNTRNNNLYVSPSQSLANIRLKKLPFFEIINECIKPTLLDGPEKCTIPNAPKGMREAIFHHLMEVSNINCITLNRDISYGKNEYPCQAQIRICSLEAGSTEITDCMPLGLHVRINNKICPLPPTAPNTRPGTEARRIPRPIHCAQLLMLNPNIINTISINWCPDGKTYVFAFYVVKKLTSNILFKRLQEKAARNADETKNIIIRKFAEFDPDLSTMTYTFSLVCPIGKVRMTIPAKSVKCDHLQCFDAITFIQMNEKRPTWMCPTCSKPCLFEDIQIENYFLEIVTSPNLPDSCEEIEILSDGTWKVSEVNNKCKSLGSSADNKEKPIDSVNLDDSDDDNDDNPTENNKEIKPVIKVNENLKSSLIDLTLSDDENQNTNNKQENEAQAVNVVQPITTAVDTTPQVQPQQAVTSSVPSGVIEIDSPSPPVTPIPTTPAY